MKKILLVAAMFLLAVTLHAKDNESKTKDSDNTARMELSGSIVDGKSGESLVGVEVKIEGTSWRKKGLNRTTLRSGVAHIA